MPADGREPPRPPGHRHDRVPDSERTQVTGPGPTGVAVDEATNDLAEAVPDSLADSTPREVEAHRERDGKAPPQTLPAIPSRTLGAMRLTSAAQSPTASATRDQLPGRVVDASGSADEMAPPPLPNDHPSRRGNERKTIRQRPSFDAPPPPSERTATFVGIVGEPLPFSDDAAPEVKRRALLRLGSANITRNEAGPPAALGIFEPSYSRDFDEDTTSIAGVPIDPALPFGTHSATPTPLSQSAHAARARAAQTIVSEGDGRDHAPPLPFKRHTDDASESPQWQDHARLSAAPRQPTAAPQNHSATRPNPFAEDPITHYQNPALQAFRDPLPFREYEGDTDRAVRRPAGLSATPFESDDQIRARGETLDPSGGGDALPALPFDQHGQPLQSSPRNTPALPPLTKPPPTAISARSAAPRSPGAIAAPAAIRALHTPSAGSLPPPNPIQQSKLHALALTPAASASDEPTLDGVPLSKLQPLISVELYAKVKVAIWDRESGLKEALNEYDVDEMLWRRNEERHAARIAAEAKAGRAQFAQEVRAAVKFVRAEAQGPSSEPLPMDRYASLRVAIELAEHEEEVLAKTELSPSEWQRIKRSWSKRLRGNRDLAKQLRRAMAKARRKQKRESKKQPAKQ